MIVRDLSVGVSVLHHRSTTVAIIPFGISVWHRHVTSGRPSLASAAIATAATLAALAVSASGSAGSTLQLQTIDHHQVIASIFTH